MTIIPGQMIPQFENKYFTDIYDNVNSFIEDYKNCGLPVLLKDESLITLFYLLYAKYGNSPIANSDENQFKYKLFAIIFEHGPAWEKRLSIQADIRALTLEDARIGFMNIANHAFNPEVAPSTQDTNELNFVSDQNVFKSTVSKLQAAKDIWFTLRTDASVDFLDEFKKLFLRVVRPQHTYIYTSVQDEQEDLEV